MLNYKKIKKNFNDLDKLKISDIANENINDNLSKPKIEELLNKCENKVIENNGIIVETDYNEKKFLFYDKNKNIIGGFTIYEFIHFILSDIKSNFLNNVNSDLSKNIIEKYICRFKDSSKKNTIEFLSQYDSPFMGNIEILIKFYTFICDFENNELNNELKKCPSESIQIIDKYNDMLYKLLTHTLKIIAIIVDKINSDTKLKESLLKYSVSIVYKISKLISIQYEIKSNEINKCTQKMLEIQQNRDIVYTKLDIVQKAIDKQNSEIDLIVRNIISKNTPEPKQVSEQSSIFDVSSSPFVNNIPDNNISDKSHIFNVNSEYQKNNISDYFSTSLKNINITDLLNDVNKNIESKN